jgi:GMP synthase-like glutamine amidotransferase
MKIAILKHDQTPPGTTVEWCEARRLEYRIYDLQFEALPSLDDFDVLILLGGEINVDEENLYSWLRLEKNLIAQAIEKQKKVIGLCLGGQLIAEVLGGKVKKHTHWEVGWSEVRIEKVHGCLRDSPNQLVAFQWHAYRFWTPPGAQKFAGNQACEDQGFIYGDHVLAMQFHPEAAPPWIIEDVSAEEYPSGPYVQTLTQIRASQHFQKPLQSWFYQLLDHFLLARKTAG